MQTPPQSAVDARSLPPFDPQEPVRITDRLDPNHDRRALNQYIRGERIGGGPNGPEVFACRDSSDGSSGYPLAVKVVKKVTKRDKYNLLRRAVAEDDNTLWSIQREIAIMKKCRHANVVRLVEVIDDPSSERIYIIMEYLAGGPIQWHTQTDEPLLTLSQTRRIIRDAVLGLEYLHFEGIIHRDIKPANLLYTRDRKTVKIVDFGVAHYIPTRRIKARDAHENRLDTTIDPELFPPRNLIRTHGTPFFQAPEINDEKPNRQAEMEANASYDTMSAVDVDPSDNGGTSSGLSRRRPPITSAIDIWSLGVTLYCFLFGHVPFVGDPPGNAFALAFEIMNSDFDIDKVMGAERLPTEGRHPPGLSNSESAILIRLLERMLTKDPKRRISLSRIKEHPWILQDIKNTREWIKLTNPDAVLDEEDPRSTWVQSGKKLLGKLIPGRT